MDDGSLVDYLDRRAWRTDRVLSEEDLETLANVLASRVDAQEGRYGCARETNSRHAVETAADEFVSASIGALVERRNRTMGACKRFGTGKAS